MVHLSRRGFLAGTASLAAVAKTVRLPQAHAKGRGALPIPAELRPDAQGEIALTAQAGTVEFVPGRATPTLGYNGPFLGPAIRVNRGDKVAFKVTNTLQQETTAHWHGLEIPGAMDGGPYNVVKPGETWRPEFVIEQPAAMCWFHPHIYPATAEQVIAGLAGLFVIDDEEEAALGLPSAWGVDDIPVILQDRRFAADGTLFHRFNLVSITTGYVGDTMLVNGANYPVANTTRGWLRLRLLNGSNARSYRLALSDGRSMYVVASDGGLLAEPVEMKELIMYPGERYQVLVDAHDARDFDLVTRPVMQMGMNLPPFDKELPLVTFSPSGADGPGSLPDALVSLAPLVSDLPAASHELVMDMLRDDDGMALLKATGLMKMAMSGDMSGSMSNGMPAMLAPDVVEAVNKAITESPVLPLDEQLSANAVNGASFEVGKIGFAAAHGTDQRWVISEGSDRMLHPVHIHGCRFRILSFNDAPPPAHMAGWKDVAPVEKGGRCEIQVRFDHPAADEAPFMAHCHILEHEDSGMMTSFTVA